MSWPRSLRERLALGAVLVTAACLLALTLAFNVLLSRQLRAGADDLLHTRAEAVAATIDVAPDGLLTVRHAAQDRSIDVGTWIYQGTVAVETPPGDREQQREAGALAGTGERTVQTAEPDAVRLYALPLRTAGRQVGTVVSSIGLDPYDRVEEIALLASGALAALVLAGAYLLTRTLVGRVLTPVAEMTQQAARWSADDLTRRFGAGERPTELETLAATLDGVLDRLSAVVRHEQQLSAELSHELRTPLAAVVAEVELLGRRPRSARELAEGHAAVLAAAERMDRVLESLLTVARAGGDSAPGRCEVRPAVCTAIASVHPPAGVVALAASPTGLQAGVDAALLERALAPVLDNALRYCRARVDVEIGTGPRGPEVRVGDDGPGVEAGLRETLFDPGVRSPDAHGGAGLGLALARRLARAGGGDLRLDSGSGRDRFLLSLPPA